MSKESRERIARAFRAMKAIGISVEKVKPDLKSLLILFDKNWALIEEENYRALADAIFDRDEQEVLQAEERSKKIVNNEEEAKVKEESVQPLKRLRVGYQDDQTSSKPPSCSLPKASLVIPKEEPNEESPNLNVENITHQSVGKNKGKHPVSSKSLVIHENSDPSPPNSVGKIQPNNQSKSESRSQSHSVRLRDRESSDISPQKPSRKKRPEPESSSNNAHLKETKVVPDIPLSSEKKNTSLGLIVPRDEPITDDTPYLEVPDSICHSDPFDGGESPDRNGTARENHDPEPLALEFVTERVTAECTTTLDDSRNNGELTMNSCENSSNLEIASSPSGEVKFYLSYEMASKRPDFHMPTLESVLKSVEDKCLRSPKTSDLYIPMVDLMKEMCQCFLQLGTDSSSHCPKSMDANPAADSMIEPTALDDLGGSGISCSTPSKLAPPPPVNGINHEQQLDETGSGDEIVTNGENHETCAKETNDLSLDVVQKPQMAL